MKRSTVTTSDDLDPLPAAAPPRLVLSFTVRGVAIPHVRVSPGRNGGAYEDRALVHWKSLVIDAAKAEIARSGWKTTAAAVRVDVEIVLLMRPTKKPRKGGELAHPIAGKGVGDFDNVLKPVFDAMTKAGVWKDDKQVLGPISGWPACGKRWQRKGEEFAGVVVRVEIAE